MTIQRLLTVSGLADSPFRSLVEVEEYLQKIKQKISDTDALEKHYEKEFSRTEKRSLMTASEFMFRINRDRGAKPSQDPTHPKFFTGKFDKVTVPDLNTLSKNFAIARDYADIIEELETMYNTVSLKFRGIKGSGEQLSHIKTMIENAKGKYQKALDFLKKVGEEYAPSQFKALVKATMEYIETGIEFKSMATHAYVHVNEEKQLQFSAYVEIKNLVTGDGVQPVFYIVFTCILVPVPKSKSVMHKLYVNVLHTFEPPGRAALGKNVTDYHSAGLAIGTMMTLEQMPNSIGTVPHLIDITTLKKNQFSVGAKVANITGDANSISFELLKSIKEPEAEEILKVLATELKSAFASKRATKPIGRLAFKEGRWIATFRMDSKEPLDVHQLDFLKDDFGLTDTQMQTIRKTLFEGK